MNNHCIALNQEQLNHYDREGYLVLNGLLNDHDLQPAREALMEKVDSIANELFRSGLIQNRFPDAPFEVRLCRLFEGLTEKEFLRFGRSWRDRMPGYFHLMSNPKILDVVESLIGPEIFSNPIYNVRPKVPRVTAGAVPWHQDKSYWPDANANPVITVWVALVDATHENGCLHLIPGTHRKRVLNHHAETYTGTAYTEIAPNYIEKRKREIVTLPVKAGSAILFNDRLIHGSTPNNTEGVRWSMDLRYQPTDQDPMSQHGVGFLARSQRHPERVATLSDWLEGRPQALGEARRQDSQESSTV